MFVMLTTRGESSLFSKLDAVKASVVGMGTAMQAALGIVSRLFDFTIGGFDDSREAARAARVMEQVLQATGHAAGLTAEQLNAMAVELQAVTNFDDDAIVALMNKLLTFKSVKGENFGLAIKAALDMAEAGFGSAEGNIVQLGKALEDPIRGLNALRRNGITFTETEREMIAAMVEAGDKASAQGMILEAIAGQLGGAAEAAADPWIQFKNTLGNLAESLATGLMPLISGFTNLMNAILPTSEQVSAALVAIGDTVEPVWRQFVETLGAVWTALSDIGSIVGGWLMEQFDALFGGLFPSFDEVRNVLAGWLADIQFLGENWRLVLALMWEETKLFASNSWERIKTFFSNIPIIAEWAADNWKQIFQTIVDFVLTIFTNLAENIKAIWNAVLDFFSTGEFVVDWTPLTEGFKSSITELPELNQAAVEESTAAIDELNEKLAAARVEFDERKAGEAFEREAADAAREAAREAASRAAAEEAAGAAAAVAETSAAAGRFATVGIAELASMIQGGATSAHEKKVEQQGEQMVAKLDTIASNTADLGPGLMIEEAA